MDDIKLKEIYNYIIDAIKDSEVYTKHKESPKQLLSLIKSQIFSVMTVIGGYRPGSLFELYPYVWGDNGDKMVHDILNKTIKKFELSNIEIRSFDSAYLIIYDVEYSDLVRKFIDNHDEYSLGVLLGFACPNDHLNTLETRISQNIYTDDMQFYAQICSKENFKKNQKTFEKQLQSYKKLGDALGVEVRMDFTKILGTKTLLKAVNSDGIDGLIKYREDLINILNNVSDGEGFKRTIDILNSKKRAELEKNSTKIKSILTCTIANIANLECDTIEDILLKNK